MVGEIAGVMGWLVLAGAVAWFVVILAERFGRRRARQFKARRRARVGQMQPMERRQARQFKARQRRPRAPMIERRYDEIFDTDVDVGGYAVSVRKHMEAMEARETTPGLWEVT